MKIGLIGCGAYGIAMAEMLHKNNKDIIMWTENEKKIKEYEKNGCIKDIIPGVTCSKDIKLTNSYEEVMKDRDIIFIMSTAHFVGSICDGIKPYLKLDQVICIASKGIENNSCEFLSNIAREKLNTRKICIISGGSFAIDMVNGNPVALTVASKSSQSAKKVKEALQSDSVKLRVSRDVIGVQICGSIKNVIALAAGMLDGMGYPESTQCFLITESIHDIKSLIGALGGKPKTILSYAGVGDLLLTCTSTKSRNFSFGKLVGEGITKEEKEKHLKENTVEGYYTLKSIYKLVKRKKISMPVVDLIYKIVMNDKDPHLLAEFLINKK